jgi:hypothetical protein
VAVWLWWISEPGARVEIRSTTVSSITTYQTAGANSAVRIIGSTRQTASQAQRPYSMNQ